MAIKIINKKVLAILGGVALLSHGYSKVEAMVTTTNVNDAAIYQDQNIFTTQILATPTGKPSSKPTVTPTPKYSSKPTAKPTSKATPVYSAKPSPKATESPEPKATPDASPKPFFAEPVQSVTNFFEGLFSKFSNFFKF